MGLEIAFAFVHNAGVDFLERMSRGVGMCGWGWVGGS